MVSYNPVNFHTKIIITLHETQHLDRAIAKDNLRFKMGSVTQFAVALIQLCTTRNRAVPISMWKRVNVLCESELKLRERDVALRGGELLLIDGNNTLNSQIELNKVFSYVFFFHINFYKA